MAPSSFVASICSLALLGPPPPRPSLPQADPGPTKPPATQTAPADVTTPPSAPANQPQTPAQPTAERLSELLDSANRAFQSEHYGSAAELFAEAYSLDPKPAYLWARAQAQRAGNLCDSAIASYKQYMSANPRPSEKSIAAAQRNVEDCRRRIRKAKGIPETKEENEGKTNKEIALEKLRALNAAKTEQEVYEAELLAERRAALKRLPPPPTRPLVADPVGLSVGGTGLAGLGVGAALLGGMLRSDEAKRNAYTEIEYAEHWNKTERLSKTWPIIMGMGAALLVGAIMRYAVKGHERRKVRKSRERLQRGIDEYNQRKTATAKRKQR